MRRQLLVRCLRQVFVLNVSSSMTEKTEKTSEPRPTSHGKGCPQLFFSTDRSDPTCWSPSAFLSTGVGTPKREKHQKTVGQQRFDGGAPR